MRRLYGPREFAYQFAFKNVGRRSIINVRLKARLRINDPRKRGGDILNYWDLALTNNVLFELKPGVKLRFSFDVHNSKSLETPLLDSSISTKLKTEEILLDDIFAIYPDAVFFVQIIGTDIYSHATKVFQSRNYSRRDIRNGKFKGTCLDIAPL